MDIDTKLEALANLHTLDVAARKLLKSIDTKLEGVTTETVSVNVEALRLVRMVMGVQREQLAQVVEHQLEIDDSLDTLMQKLNIDQ